MRSPCVRLLSLLPVLGALALAGPLPAQTFVVDAANGPGTSFTDLPPAVAGVPSGATLLVRPGIYSTFSLANKDLTIVGQRSATGAFPMVVPSILLPGIFLGPTAAGQSVTVSGLDFSSTGSTSARLDVRACAGPVWLEDMLLSFQSPFTLAVVDSPDVHVARVIVSAFVVTGPTPSTAPIVIQGSGVELSRVSVAGYRQTATGGSGTAAIQASLQSRLVAVDCSVDGGAGLGSGSAGGPAITLSGGSVLHAFANQSAITSRPIGGGFGSFGQSPGRGGDGLVLQGGSFARVWGAVLTGGFGTPSGQPFVADATSTVDYDPSRVTPSAALVGVLQPGNTVRYSLHAAPGSAAWLLVGLDAQLQMLPVLRLGALGVQPTAVLPLGTVPASGLAEVPSVVPASWPTAAVVFAQFAVFDPAASQLAVSNAFTATSRF